MVPNIRAGIALVLATLAGSSFAADVKHDYDLQNVLWHLSFSMKDGTIAGDVTNTLVLSEATPTVQLSCADLKVSQVTVNGADAKFANADGVLTVTLPSPGANGQKLDVRTVYTGTPAIGFYFVAAAHAFPAHTDAVYTQGEGEDNHYWLPTYDKPDDKATTEAFITVPPTWTAISNGKLMDVQSVAGGKVFHWKMDQPYSTYLISLVAGEYVKGGDTWRNIPVDYYVPPGLEAEGKTAFDDTSKMIELYSKLTGFDYPYPKFAQEAVADFMFGGMENITAVTQTIRTLHPASTEPLKDSDPLVAHELAHQWFGDLVTCRTWEHMWLNEGFASTLPIFWDRDGRRDRDLYDFDRYNTLEGAVDTIGSRGRKDMPGAVGASPTVNIGSPYAGGASRIFLLMYQLGEPLFWKGIHAYLEAYKFAPATTDDFFNVMSKVSGKDLHPFEKQWFYSTATPSLTVSLAGTTLTVTQLAPYFTLDLPVWILETPSQTTLFSSPVWDKKVLHLTGATGTLALTADQAKLPILVDPEATIPMELSYKILYTGDQVKQLYNRAPNVAEKGRVISELFNLALPGVQLAIAQGERSPYMHQLLVKHFGSEGKPYFLTLTHSHDSRIVDAGVIALGNLPPDPAVTKRLELIAEQDPNENVREDATEALLNGATDDKLAQKAFKTKAFDDGFRVEALEWMGKHQIDAARTTCLQILQNPDSERLRTAAIEVLGVVKEKPGEHAVFDALISVAKENTYRARLTAVNSLGALGNKAAIPVLQPLTTRAPGGIRGAAVQAIANLSK